MSIPSNLYAEKVFAEHPTALWSLDEKIDYISLISETQRNIPSLWTVENATATSGTSVTGEPFPLSFTTKVKGDVPTGATNEIILTSPNIYNFSNLNQDFDSFSIGSYIYSNSPYLESFSIGYQYIDPDTLNTVNYFDGTNSIQFQKWNFISSTFSFINQNVDFKIVIKILTNSGGLTIDSYEFDINGISVGQWSEEFHTTSLGIETSILDSNIFLLGGEDCVPAYNYGSSTHTGYYLASNKSLRCRQNGIPLVFGSSSSKTLFQNEEIIDYRRWNAVDDEDWAYWEAFGLWDDVLYSLDPIAVPRPSFIIPGLGFLNEKGRYKEYTVEFWAKIDSDTYTPKKIFGPIASSSGLYVDGAFLTLVIDGKYKSHFVGEWYRPMLIQFRIIKNSASLILNGEEVISLTIDTDTINLPQEFSSGNKNQDWLGFYSYTDIATIDIDCIAIYQYQVPTVVAKRRWVYGQGVVSSENIDLQYGGSPAFIDYTFADYTSNYSYPSFAKWDQGNFDNLEISTKSIQLPEYALPQINLGSKTLDEFYLDNYPLQSNSQKFFTFRPNSSWNDLPTYISFDKLDMLSSEVAAFYGVFEYIDDNTPQILFKLYNQSNKNYFVVTKTGNNISYDLFYNGETEQVCVDEITEYSANFVAGININTFCNTYGDKLSAFFGNQNILQVMVAGDSSGDAPFLGRIYSIGFSTNDNYVDIADNFNDNGTTKVNNFSPMKTHTASYTLLPLKAYSTFALEVGSAGSWEDYMPLSYFGQYVTDQYGDDYYNLDFLQFNIGYSSVALKTEEDPTHYDTNNDEVKSYVTFQYILDGANKPKDYFTNVEKPNSNYVLDISQYPNWETTKFEILDNTIVYPPTSVDFNNLAVVYHLEFASRSSLTKKLPLSKLDISSQAFNDNSFNPIGTRYGIEMYPYTKSGFYYDYNTKNPYSIYKGTTPYMYLTKNSGIKVIGDFPNNVNRGISIPVNKTKSSGYKVSAFQTFIKYDQESFPATTERLFEIDYKSEGIEFYIVANSDTAKRGKIVARSKNTGKLYTNVKYYINGVLVKEPVLSLDAWTVLGISFPESINFDSYIGKININGKAIFNNVTAYQSTSLQQVQSSLIRPWLYVKEVTPLDFNWQYWANDFLWQNVLVISSSDLYGVNLESIYKNYFGSNKIIIDDSNGIDISTDRVKVYQDVTWSVNRVIPV